ncbi:DUF881 domain-containing protein [Bowdeniella massiliensis]|uniref:DUF881 domain-containing protein n=1 Tax=Bowdeniella massiliensis TaxID=2932264 RepID=UPI00202959E7|nr:DUF881 domain-containing protein [Bowdeniella massiliensis]
MSPSSWHRRSSPSVSGAVLRKILEDPVDIGYSKAAKQRPYPPWQKASIFFLSIVIGASAVWATHALRAPSDAAAAARQSLADQVDAMIAHVDSNVQKNLELNEAIEDARKEVIDEAPLVSQQLATTGAASGVVAVSGPGIVLTLDDRDVEKAEGRVKDFDFQVLVNSLWSAGAEAISINGQRIGPTTAIRSAGQAVLVNLIPLAPPYEISVIADPTDIQAAFAKTRGSAHLAGLRDMFGVRVDIASADELSIPAAQQARLRYVSTDSQVGTKVAK